ncbi:MAG: nucleotidyltransferase domain-containing protein [Firmicutes bacterium]|nr:nucleotidyltransferase domain-containing protein [Bacillota bacterium]
MLPYSDFASVSSWAVQACYSVGLMRGISETEFDPAGAVTRAQAASRFPQVRKLILFGSAARGSAGPESDVDLLVLTDRVLPTSVKHEIYDLVFDINLRYDARLSVICVGEDQWERGPLFVPIRPEVEREGVAV